MTDHLIALKNIHKKYRTEDVETSAVNGLSLCIPQGEFLAIMGPSGCGKSTLLNLIGMLDKADEGEYVFLDREISQYNAAQLAQLRKHQIGFVFQNFNLIDELNVTENIGLPLRYQSIARKDANERVKAVMEQLNIAHRAKHFPQQLSGGQQQRVAVGRALVSRPKIILADEPTGNLDSKNGLEVMELLKSLNNNGTTVIMVTHNEHDASFCNRIVKMMDGQIINPV